VPVQRRSVMTGSRWWSLYKGAAGHRCGKRTAGLAPGWACRCSAEELEPPVQAALLPVPCRSYRQGRPYSASRREPCSLGKAQSSPVTEVLSTA